MRLAVIPVFALAIWLLNSSPKTTDALSLDLNKTTYQAVPTVLQIVKPVEPVKTVTPQPQQPTAPAVEQVKPAAPAPWQVSRSPHARVSVVRINTVLAHLQKKGLTKQGAAYLVGNFIAESYVEPCDRIKGDGGLAWGLAQWHPGRRADMPCDLIAQLDWAIDVEMARDSKNGKRYPNLRDRLIDPNQTAQGLLLGFKQWERYGIEGNRGKYGAQIHSQL